MRGKIFILLIFLICSFSSYAQQTWVWAKEAVSGSPEQGNDVAVDSITRDVYVCGEFRDNLSAAFGASFASTYGGQDGFVAKYTENGFLVWAFKIGGSSVDNAAGIITDNAGYFYVTGGFSGTAQFKGTTTSQSISLTSAGQKDSYIAKYNSAGELQWVVQGSNTGNASSHKIIKNSTYLFTAGEFDGAAGFSFGGLPSLSPAGNFDGYIAVHDFNGTPVALKKVGGTANDFCYDIAADETNYYVIGTFFSSVFNLYNDNSTIAASLTNYSSGSSDVFYASYSIAGALQWAKNLGSNQSQNDQGYGIAQNGNHLYLTGCAGPNAVFPPLAAVTGTSGLCPFLGKAEKSNGNCQWGKVFNDGSPADGVARDVKAKFNKVWVTGEYVNTTNFGGISSSSTGNNDIFVASYLDDGTIRYVKSGGASGNDQGFAIALQGGGTIYMTGQVSPTAAFDATVFSNSNGLNFGIAKLACNTGSGTISGTTTICAGSSANLNFNFIGASPYNFTYSDGSSYYYGSGTSATPSVTVSPGTTKTYTLVALSTGGNCDALSSNLTGSPTVTVIPVVANNSISSNQTICTGSSPALLSGSTPTGGTGAYVYSWEQSSDSLTWTVAAGTNNTQNYQPSSLTTTTYFRRIVTSSCAPLISNVIKITVEQNITANTISSSQTVCNGQTSSTITGSTSSGGNGTYSYLWEQSNDSISWSAASGTNTGINYSAGTIASTLFYRRVVTAGTCPSATSNTVVVTVLSTVGNNTIGSNETICEGQSASVVTGSAPTGGNGTFTYSWEQSPDNLIWSAASGTNNLQSYSPGAITSTTYYRRVVTSAMCPSVTSNTVQVTVVAPITNNTISANQSVCSTQNPMPLTGSWPGGGTLVYTYLWEQSTDNVSWSSASGINSLKDYTPPVLGVTTYFRRQVSSSACSSTSNTITVTVTVPVTMNTITASQTICNGQAPAPFSGSVPGGGTGAFSYVWEQSTDNILWNASSGTNSSQNYSAPSLNTTTYYRRQVSSGSCPSDISNTITVTVLPSIGNNTISAAQTICSGQTPTPLNGSAPTGGNNSYTYTWQQSTDNVMWIPAAGANTNQNYSPGSLTATTYFRRLVSSAMCSALTSNTITITVQPVIATNTITTNQTICSGQTPSQFNGSFPSGGDNSYAYQWQQSSDNISWSAANGTNSLKDYSAGALVSTMHFRRIVSSGVCASSTSNTIIITVLPNITSNTISATQTICSGQSAAPLNGSIPSGGDNSYSYLWQQSTDNITWTTASGVNNLQGYNPGILTTTMFYRRQVISAMCATSTSASIIINVNPVITNNTITSNQTLCGPQTPANLIGSTPSGGSGSYVYLWEVSTDNISWSSASGTNSNKNYSPGLISTTTYFRRQVTSGPCSSTSSVLTITIEPVISNNTINSSQTICSGQTPAILTGSTPTGGNNTYSYLWEQSANNVSWSNATGINTGINYSPPALTSTMYYRRLVNSGSCPAAPGNVITISVDPVITNNTISSNQTICSYQTPAQLSGSLPSGGNSSYSYTWQQSNDNVSWTLASGVNALQNYSSGPLTSTTYYRRIVNSSTCNAITSNVITITVQPELAFNSVTANQTICAGQSPAQLIGSVPTGGNGTFSYIWEQSTNNLTWTAASGTNTLKDYSPPSLSATMYYRRNVSSGSCTAITSNTITITVLSGIAGNSIATPQTICSGQAASPLTGSTPTGGNSSYSYLWEQSNDNITWVAASGTNNLQGYSPGVLTSTTYFRRVVTSAMCASNSSSAVLITVLPVITNNTISSNQTLCGAQAPATLTGPAPSGGSGTFTYLWEQSTDNIIWTAATGTNNTQNYSPSSISVVHYFRRIVTSGSCTSTSNTITVTVEPVLTNNTVTSSQTICSGQIPSGLTGSVPFGGNGSYAYTWQSSIDNISWTAAPGINSGQNYAPGSLTVTTYYRRVVNSSTCSSLVSNVITIVVDPLVTNNSVLTNQSVCYSQTPSQLSGSVPAGGNNAYAYTWQESSDNITWSTASGINYLQNYSPPALTSTMYYRRIVNSSTCSSSISNVVTITVQPLLSANTISLSQTICSGQTPSQLTGSTPSGGNGTYAYQWEQSSDNITWSNASGANNSIYYNPSALTSTTYFRRIASSGSCPNDISNTVTITVLPLISNNSITSSQTVCASQAGSPFNGTLPSGGDNSFTYLWQQSTDNISWVSASGTNNLQSYSPGVLPVTTYFRRQVTSAMCANSISNTISITVTPGLSNNTVGSNQTWCGPQTVNALTGSLPSGGSGTYVYAWEESNDNITWSAAAGVNNTQNYNPGTISSTTYFRRLVSSGTCSSTSNSITITIQPVITNNSISNSQTICSGQTPAAFTGSLPAGGNSTFTYLWEQSPDNISWVVASGTNTGQHYSPPSLTSTTYYRRQSSSGACAATLSNIILIVVDPLITNNTIASNQTICSGQSASQITGSMPAGGNNSYVYQWEQSSDSLTWVPASGTNSLQNYSPGSVASTIYFRRIVSSSTCTSAISNVVKITVQPVLANNSISSSQTICADQTPSTFLGTAPTGGSGLYTYTWEQSYDLLSWSPANGFNNLQDFSESQLSSTTYYRRIVSSGVCASSVSSPITVTVIPSLSNNSISTSQTVCSSQTPSTLTGSTPSGGDNTYSYMWEMSTDSISWTSASGTNNLQNYSPGVLPVTTHFRRYVTSGICDSSISNTVTITVYPGLLNNLIDTSQTICGSQTAAALTGSSPTGGSGSYTYLWEESIDNLTWYPATGTNNFQGYNPGSISNTLYFRRQVTSGICTSISNTVTITVEPVLTNNVISSNQTICSGQTPSALAGSLPTGGNGSFTYSWQESADSITWNTTGVSAQNYSPSALFSTMHYRRIVSSSTCSSDTSDVITVQVDPIISSNTISSNQRICFGQNASALNGSIPTGGTNSYSYAWEESPDNLSWMPAAGTNTSANLTPIGPSSSTYYRRGVSSGTCPQDFSNSVFVDVLPGISNNIISSNQTICAGQSAALLSGTVPAGGDSSYSFAWETSLDNVSWSPAGGTNNLQDYLPTPGVGITYYRRTVSSAGCTISNSNVVTIIVEPAITSNSISSNQVICSGQSPSALSGSMPLGGNGSFAYQWEESSDGVSWTNLASGTSQNYSPGTLSDTTYFRRVVTSGSCPTDTSNTIVIEVAPLISNNSISANQLICAGQTPVTLSGSLPTGGDNAYTYLWEESPDNLIWTTAQGTSTTQNYSPGILTSDMYYRRIVSSFSCAASVSDTISIIVQPVISNNSISSNQNLCTGSTPALLNGSAPSGGNGSYSYAWEESADNVTWIAASGINNTQSYAPSSLSDTMYYRRTVSSGTCANTFSNTVTILVYPAVSNNTIDSNQVLCSGQIPAQLNGSVPSGGNSTFVFNWKESTDSLTWLAASGTNNLQYYSPPSVSTKTYYLREVTSGGCTASSNVITIDLATITNNSISGNQQICSGDTAAMIAGSAVVSNSAIVYLWEESADSINWAPATGTNTLQDYYPGSPSSIMYYRRKVSSAGCDHYSNITKIIVVAPVSNNTIPVNDTICSGQSVTLTGSTPSGGTNAYTYTWEESVDGVTWSVASGVNTFSNYTSGFLTDTTYYRRIVSSAGCAGLISNMAEVLVLPAVSGNTISSSQTVCTGQQFAMLTGSIPSGGDGTFTYQWMESIDGVNWSTATGTSNQTDYLPTGTSGTIYYQRLVTSGMCSSVTSNMVTLTVLPAIAANTISSNQNLCAGQTASILNGSLPTGGNGVFSYFWEESPDNLSWTPASGISNQQNYSPGALSTSMYYRRTVSSAQCTGTESSSSAAVLISVTNVITNNIVSGAQVICEGSSPSMFNGNAASGGNGTYNYSWEQSTDSVNWSIAAGTNNGQNYASGILTISTFFRRIVFSGSCSDTSNVVKVDVQPSITLNNVGNSQSICSGSTAAILSGTVTPANPGYVYLWQHSITGISWSTASGTSNNVNYSPGAIGISMYYRRIVSTSVCSDTSAPLMITVNSLPAIVVSGNDSICAGENFTISFTLTGTAPWTINYSNGVNQYVHSANSALTEAIIQPVVSGTYIVTGVTDGNGCAASSISGSATVNVSQSPIANAGEDIEVCGLTCNLNAIPSFGTGTWEWNQDITLSDATLATSSVTAQNQGEYTLTWKERNGKCVSSDNVILRFYEPVQANAGEDQEIYFTNSTMLNGNLPAGASGEWILTSGGGSVVTADQPQTEVTGLADGENIFKWVLRNGVCPISEDEMVVKVNQLIIPSVFTPNGDNVNETFAIKNLEQTGSHSILIINRWGQEVYSAEEYKNDWGGLDKEGKELPDDTYYYLLKIDGNIETGYVIVRRR